MNRIPDSEYTEPTRPVTPLPKEKFSLSRRDWTAYLLGVTVILLMEPFQRSASDPIERLVPYISGKIAALLILGILAALVAFYLSRRSQKAASVTFMVVVALGTMGQVGEVARNRRGALDDEAVLNHVVPAFLGWLKEQMTPYQRACETVADKSPLRPSWLKERTDLVAVREQILLLRRVNEELRDLYDRAPTAIRNKLAEQGVPEADRPRLSRIVSDQFGKTKTVFAAMRDQDEAIATEYLTVCDLLNENWGHWHSDANADTIVFDNDTTNKWFSAAKAKVLRLFEEQERDRTEFLMTMQQGGKRGVK